MKVIKMILLEYFYYVIIGLRKSIVGYYDSKKVGDISNSNWVSSDATRKKVLPFICSRAERARMGVLCLQESFLGQM